ncbi:MAG: IS3 family transposase [Candidatus Aminicenantales bacterium]
MKYRFMDRCGSGFEVKKMSEVLGVSRSGYYAYQERDEGPRSRENEKLGSLIQMIWSRSRELYGSPRITAELRAQGLRCGKNRVARLMREAGIRSQTKKAFKVTTRSGGLTEAEDLVQRQFRAERPGQVWVSDITYIRTKESWLYLAVVLDLHNRGVVGWALERRIGQELVLTALNQALVRHPPEKDLVFHADRGGQYRGQHMKRLLMRAGIRLSLGGRGDCYDNAAMESFFSTLKSELIHREKFRTEDEARRKIFDYIEVYYNRERRHSTLDYQTPAEYASATAYA